MDELERRLRSALTEMAEEVPPSHHAWTELERRLALKSRRSRRRPALMAAAAAAVVALISVPVLLFDVRSENVQAADPASPPPPSDTSLATRFGQVARYTAIDGETLLTAPYPVNNVSANKDVLAYSVRRTGLPYLCFATVAYGGKVNGPDQEGTPQCQQITTPLTGRLLWISTSVPGRTAGTYIYVMSHPVDNLLIWKGGGGGWASAHRAAECPDFVLLVTYGHNEPPAKYTARNAGNTVNLEHGP
jgi:hypothetical protein